MVNVEFNEIGSKVNLIQATESYYRRPALRIFKVIGFLLEEFIHIEILFVLTVTSFNLG